MAECIGRPSSMTDLRKAGTRACEFSVRNEDWTIQFHLETGVGEFQCTGPRGCILMDRSVARHPRPWHAIIDGEAADTADSSGDELMLGYQTMWRAACDAQPTDTFAEASGHHFAAHQGTCSARPQAGP